MTSPTPRVPLGTKAQTLDRLRPRLTTATVLDQLTLTVAEWAADRDGCVRRIQSRYAGRRTVVRSSAACEDTATDSAAGVYDSVLDVVTDDPRAVADAVDAVVRAYERKPPEDGTDLGGFEILVQPMLRDVTMSGVVLSRELQSSGPYLVVNYDEGGRTDTVTAGAGDTQRVVRVHHGADPASLDAPLDAVVATLREVMDLTGEDDLDMEFAVSGGRVHVFQVRPLVAAGPAHAAADAYVRAALDGVKAVIRDRDRPRTGVYGSRTAYSDMTDWNPAEIIGTRPRPLAVSLYRRLVMKDVWREARRRLGYHDPAPHHLMVTLGGHPYVDIRNDFNSYLPADLGPELSHKLIDHYLDRLRAFPELHDKAEFDICATSLAFDFPEHERRMAEAGFDQGEIDRLRDCLRRLTTRVVRGGDGQFEEMRCRIVALTARRERTLAAAGDEHPLLVAETLLDDGAAYGTLPFSVVVRGAFIATAFWRSLLATGVISREEHDGFLTTVETVSTEFTADLDRHQRGALPREDFLARYGHLRPGTYDITVPSYRDAPDRYLAARRTHRETAAGGAPYVLPEAAKKAIQAKLDEFGFDFGADVLLDFVRETRVLRERYKFEFTKNLSHALDFLAEFGARHGLSRDDLSFLSVEDLLGQANRELTGADIDRLRLLAEHNREHHALQARIHLPDVITGLRDVEVIESQVRLPNFVTSRRTTAPAVAVSGLPEQPSVRALAGRVVLAENADPGYEWLFSHDIAGLVTKYGGAASHMTIRCAEFGIPAAIGCGEAAFERLLRAETITLDCAAGRVGPAHLVP
ncbi:PEP-utilizing enzyme [Streptomyces sp. A012304]|uniref:PEP-utilizing enzyme n=1 Tax=Streptomyces sp. A012304 TaxID=375446 RepID=UPI002232B2AE|nr:PEP-utilizing enzyme [Streptomyces sp. A012304]GKQ39567.1 pyruvate, phosphate dikinase [Streptomyces sp. A012304]